MNTENSQNVASKLLAYNNFDKRHVSSDASKAVDTTAAGGPKLGTWSYANMYEALYNKFSQYKNFNLDMWRESIEFGEQDQYLALLEQNKDNTLSSMFYDENYYDYERMMLELYLPQANKENSIERFTTKYDPTTGEEYQESLGNMSDYDWISYQINLSEEIRLEEIARQQEEDAKENMSWWAKTGHTVLATAAEFGIGISTGLAGVADLFRSLGYATAEWLADGENWADAYVEYYGEKGWLAFQQRGLVEALAEYERTHTYFRDIDGNMTNLGKYLGGVANSIGMMIPSILVNMAAPGFGQFAFYGALYSQNLHENASDPYKKEAPAGWIIGNAAAKTAAEAVIEIGLSKVFGVTSMDKLRGAKGTGKVLSDQTVKAITKWTGFKYLLKEMGQEGVEEFLQDLSSMCIDAFTGLWEEGYGRDGFNFQTLTDAFIAGALSSMVMGSVHVGISATSSAIKNRRNEKVAKELGIEPSRPGDIYVQTEKGNQKITGYNRLWFSNLISTFNDNVKKLSKEKFSVEKNMKIAQETYASYNALMQYYSQIGEERMKNVERLLNRVMDIEKTTFESLYSRAATILSPETIAAIMQSDTDVQEQISEQASGFMITEKRSLALKMKGSLEDMIGELGREVLKAAKKVVDDKEEEFEKGGVTDIKGAFNKEGESYSSDPDVKNLTDKLTKKQRDAIDKYLEEYTWVFTTDGHIAIPSDDILFVSEAWLENFEVDEVQTFLAKSHVFERLLKTDGLKTLFDEVHEFGKIFSGDQNISRELAAMNFLFNKDVFQAFLLSNDGKRLREFNSLIFTLHHILDRLSKESGYLYVAGKFSKKRQNILEKIIAQIKETMREPTIKAILHWNMELSDVHAGSVLNDRDRSFIRYYKARSDTLNQVLTSKRTSAYEHKKDQLVADGGFSEKQLEAIARAERKDATIEEKILARVLLDEADRYSLDTSYGESLRMRISAVLDALIDTAEEISRLQREGVDTPEASRTKVIGHYKRLMSVLNWMQKQEITKEYAEEISATLQRMQDNIVYDTEAKNEIKTIVMKIGDIEGLVNIEHYVLDLVYDAARTIPHYHEFEDIERGALTIPYQALALNTPENHADAQFVADKLNEFVRRYGISAQQMICGDLKGMSLSQRDALTEDISLFGVDDDNLVRFVILKLESMLGDNFVVTPSYSQISDRDFVDTSINHSNAELLERVHTELSNAINWFDRLEKDIDKIKSQETAYKWLEDFDDLAYLLRPSQYSDVSDFLSPAVSNFFREFDNLWQYNAEDTTTLKWLMNHRDDVLHLYDELYNDISSTDISYEFEPDKLTYIHDFVVAKKVPVNMLLPNNILNADVKYRNDIFIDVLRRAELDKMPLENINIFKRTLYEIWSHKNAHKRIFDALKIEMGSSVADYIETLLKTDAGLIEKMYEHYFSKGVILDPITGEILDIDENGRAELLSNIIKTFKYDYKKAHLSDFFDLSVFDKDTREQLSLISVRLADAGKNAGGYYDSVAAEIIISPDQSDYIATLVHEFNHALQDVFGLPNGFNWDTAAKMPDFLEHVANNYREFFTYVLNKEQVSLIMWTKYRDKWVFLPDAEHIDIYLLSDKQREILSYCAYSLVQGEIWARAFSHNENVHGFTLIRKIDADFILTPDGKTKFRCPYSVSFSPSMSVSTKASPQLAESAMLTSLKNVLTAKTSGEQEGFINNKNIRNTYHTRLTRVSDFEVIESILKSSLSWATTANATIEKIILDPTQYLSDEILATMNGDYSEGNVYYRLRQWIENHYEGISIDRRDGREHGYVLVDDNSFDDLLLPSKQSLAEDADSTSLYKEYNKKEISLTTFYKANELAKLGVNENVKVKIASDVVTETIFDRQHPQGFITINANEATSNRTIIDRLNHEFRHIMQHYNGLTSGFTMNFAVSKELISDVKRHVPEIFVDKDLNTWAKETAKTNKSTADEEIVRAFVYYLNSGELNAYGIEASLLSIKPVYVTYEAGKPTIFMPWYNAKSGEGRYKTEFLANRSDDASTPKTRGISFRNMPQLKKKEKDTRPRYFSHKKAKGTNLEYFEKKGSLNQLNPMLQDFVVATTGNDDRLPPALRASIHRGDLSMQSFKKWFRQANDINDFTFKLINKHIFKNDYINSLEQLDSFLAWKPQVYWALNIILLKKGASLQTLVTENDLDSFMHFMESAENAKLWKEVLELSKNFDNYQVGETDSGKPIYEHIGVDLNLHRYMRVYAMEYFDGTLAGAFTTANAFRKTLFRQETEARESKSSVSINQSINNEYSDDKEMTLEEKISVDDVVDDEFARYGNDIIAIYDEMSSDKEESIDYILFSKYLKDVDDFISSLDKSEGVKKTFRKKLNDIEKLQRDTDILENKSERSDEENTILKNNIFILKKYRQLIKDRPALRKSFMNMSLNEIASRVRILKDAETMGIRADSSIYDTNKTFAKEYSDVAKIEISQREKSSSRINVVARIKGRASTIINFVNKNVISFDDLPEDVQNMFEYITITDEKTKRKVTELKLKQEVYSVGRGRAKLPGLTDTNRKDYAPKHEILEGNKAYQHNTDELLDNERVLVSVVEKIRQKIKEKQEESNSLKRVEESSRKKIEELKQKNARLSEELKNMSDEIKSKSNVTRQIEVKSKKKTSDTPNVFQIISSVQMPDVLYDIYDVSFNEMADTRVQHVSKDKDGKYYDKETMKAKDFNSVVKHEVANWDAFYEAVRPRLLSLTRSDVLDIVEFIELGVTTIGPSNKLSAFNMFLLGYFIEAARSNTFDWNFSAAQISHIESLFESLASEAGIVLNTVKQMRDVIDPLKRVRQRMFDEWVIFENNEAEKDSLIKQINDLQNEKDVASMKEKAIALSQRLKDIQKAEFEARNKSVIKFWKKNFWTKDNFVKLYKEVKSFRYLAMLSSPITWIRNKVSNVVTFVLNKSSDAVAKLIFINKGYRKNQWEISKVKISDDVKNFIESYIKENPMFNPLYELSGKYDERQRKKIKGEQELFVNLITSAIEQKYAANHRFDRNVWNKISTFINNRMSDKSFVKFATTRYFGKILTLEYEKGKIDLSKGLTDDVLNLFAESIIIANQEYMHKASFLSDSIDKFAGEHPVLYETISWFQPFLNSSFNWFVETLKYTPFGLISAIHRMTKLEQQIDKIDTKRTKNRELVTDSRITEFLIRRDIGKGTVGLILSLLGLILGLYGILDFEEDDETIYVIAGDVKVDISNIFASSSVLIGASVAQHWVKQSDGDVMSAERVLDMSVGYMLDGFFLNDVLERHRWDTGIYEGILTETESVLRSFVPQIWQLGIRALNNEKIKYSSGMKGMWERWLNSFVPKQPFGERKINPYTGEIETKYALPFWGELLKGGVLGPKIYWYKLSETELFARDYGVNKNQLTGELTIKDANGNSKEFALDKEQLNIKYGILNKMSLTKIKSQKHRVEMPNGKYKTLSWDQMSDDQRKRVINRTMIDNAEYAKIYVWTSMGHKYYASDADFIELRKLGITQNVYKGDKGFVE